MADWCSIFVNYTVSGGQANASDFGGVLPSGSVNLAAGQANATLTINVSGDTVFEPDESFTVTISLADRSVLAGSTTAVGTIRNDDFRVYVPIVVNNVGPSRSLALIKD